MTQTNLPWEAGKALFHKGSGEGELFSAGDVHIYPPIGGGPGPIAIVAGEEYAALIVRAVNNHDALVEALDDLVASIMVEVALDRRTAKFNARVKAARALLSDNSRPGQE